jgi:P27 family predicted phage terminase small subunit
MRGRKSAKVVAFSPKGAVRAPEWLTEGAKREWRRCSADQSRRGLLFDGALAGLAHYAALVDQIEQLAGIVAKEGLVGETAAHPAQRAMLAAMAQARMLAAELGLSVVSRARSFTAQAPAKGDGFEELVG